MKSRPRRAENQIADHLSQFFTHNSLSPIERIPVLGRTGPDLTINESGLIADVKSRQACPKSTFSAVKRTGKARNKQHTAFQLDQLQECFIDNPDTQYMPLRYSKVVDDWLSHMDEWTKEFSPWGISGIILHTPQLPYGQSVLIIARSDVRTLRQHIIQPEVIGRGEIFLRLLEDDTLAVHSPNGQATIPLTPENLSTLHQWTRRP